MFNVINLYVAIHDISVLIIKVAVLMHEHVHSCLHLSIVNKMLFDIHFINYVYLYFIYHWRIEGGAKGVPPPLKLVKV